MYPSTEMLISVQKYKLQYGKISPVLSTPNNSSSEKKYQSLSKKNISSRTNIFIDCATIFFIHVYNSTIIFFPVQKKYISVQK